MMGTHHWRTHWSHLHHWWASHHRSSHRTHHWCSHRYRTHTHRCSTHWGWNSIHTERSVHHLSLLECLCCFIDKLLCLLFHVFGSMLLHCLYAFYHCSGFS